MWFKLFAITLPVFFAIDMLWLGGVAKNFYRALEKTSWRHALFAGAAFGFITYATYDLTNLATMKDWPVLVTVVDLAWGTVLSASVSVISFAVARKLGM